MVDAIESRLGENQWLGGQQPSKDDAAEFLGLSGAIPNVDSHPNAFAWYAMVGKFTDAVKSNWAAGAAPAKGGADAVRFCSLFCSDKKHSLVMKLTFFANYYITG